MPQRTAAAAATAAFCLGLALAWASTARAEPVLPPQAAPSSAGTNLSAEAFDALTRGRTMDTHDEETGRYGVETFLPGRRVIWRDAAKCTRGIWEEIDGQICFTYEQNDNNPVCWEYEVEGDFIRGWYRGDRGTVPIRLEESTQGPVSCEGWLGA